jgi:hypothetical protein
MTRPVLRSLSDAQGGFGVSAKQQTTITQIGVETSIGESPTGGTNCSVFLACNSDHAYDNAVVSFYAVHFGRRALWSQVTISPAANAAQKALLLTAVGFAGDAWEVTLTLAGGTTPANFLQSSIQAGGKEIPGAGGGTATGTIVEVVGSFTGPSASGEATLSPPAGLSTWMITLGARIVSSSVDPVGDGYSTVGQYSFVTNAGGVVQRLLPIVELDPMQAADSLMSTMSVPDPSVSGGLARVGFVTATGLDPSTVVKVVVTFQLLQSVL